MCPCIDDLPIKSYQKKVFHGYIYIISNYHRVNPCIYIYNIYIYILDVLCSGSMFTCFLHNISPSSHLKTAAVSFRHAFKVGQELLQRQVPLPTAIGDRQQLAEQHQGHLEQRSSQRWGDFFIWWDLDDSFDMFWWGKSYSCWCWCLIYTFMCVCDISWGWHMWWEPIYLFLLMFDW